MKSKQNKQSGFSYIEVLIAMVILMVGILAQLSALSFSMVRVRDNELRNTAREIAGSTVESIFAARDLGFSEGTNKWNSIDLTNNSSEGIFVPGWHPIRQDAGQDGILGTLDDACSYNTVCTVNGYQNSGELDTRFERQILITKIIESGITDARKKNIKVKVRYFIGQLQREETFETVIANLPSR